MTATMQGAVKALTRDLNGDADGLLLALRSVSIEEGLKLIVSGGVIKPDGIGNCLGPKA